jgi:hypothetical protein
MFRVGILEIGCLCQILFVGDLFHLCGPILANLFCAGGLVLSTVYPTFLVLVWISLELPCFFGFLVCFLMME